MRISKIFVELKIFKKYFESLSRYLYPIVDSYEVVTKIEHFKYSINHVIAFIFMLYLLLETIAIFVFIGYDLDNPYMLHHVVSSFLPKLFLKQSDFLFPTGYFTSVYFYWNLIFDKMAHAEFLMFPINKDSRILTSLKNKGLLQLCRILRFLILVISLDIGIILSHKLISFREKTEWKLEAWLKYMLIQIRISYLGPLILIELYKIFVIPKYKIKYRIWICVILFLLLLHYLITFLKVGFQFVYLNMLINIKQKYYLFLMRSPLRYHNNIYFEKMLNKCLMHTKEINAFNTFYSKYITALIFLYSFNSSCVIISAQHVKNVSSILLLSWIVITFFYLSSIFFITFSGSKTISLNKKMFMTLFSLQISLCNRRRTPSRGNIIHLDLVNEYKTLLIRTSFRLITSSLLNNKFFIFTIIGFVSGIYMKVIQRK